MIASRTALKSNLGALITLIGVGGFAAILFAVQPAHPHVLAMASSAAPAVEYPAQAAAPVHVITMGEIEAERMASEDKARAAVALHAEMVSPMPMRDITGDPDRDLNDWAHDN